MHPAYDDYPVVGVTWKQARAFCIWRTQLLNSYLQENGESFIQDLDYLQNQEWEYAARGGYDLAPYPSILISETVAVVSLETLSQCVVTIWMMVAFASKNNILLAKRPWLIIVCQVTCLNGQAMLYEEAAYNFLMTLTPDYSYDAKDLGSRSIKEKSNSWRFMERCRILLQTGTRLLMSIRDTAKCYVGFPLCYVILGLRQS